MTMLAIRSLRRCVCFHTDMSTQRAPEKQRRLALQNISSRHNFSWPVKYMTGNIPRGLLWNGNAVSVVFRSWPLSQMIYIQIYKVLSSQ